MSVYSITVDLLKKSSRSMKEISDDLGYSVRWLESVKAMTGDPGVKKIEELHDYLVKENKHRQRQARKDAK